MSLKIGKIDKNTILIGVAILAILVTGALIYGKSGNGFSMPSLFGPSAKEIGQKAVDYINNNQLSSTPASVVSTTTEDGLIKIKIKIGSTEFDSYATKDGKFLFPQAFDMSAKKDGKTADNTNTKTSGSTTEEILASLKKSDKPVVEAFIVSRCPFGLQMQRMVAEAIKSVPSLTDYIKIKYIGSVSGDKISSMHGEAEATENLRQICIREEQPTKYWPYVSCQMNSGDTAGCEKSTGVDSAKLNSCTSDKNKGVAYAKKDFDAATASNVAGSPTLVVNGVTVEEFTPDNKPVFGSGRSADEMKTIVCKTSNKEPSFCSQKLSTAQAATSFSATYEGSGSTTGAAGCGN